jgi:2-amino-4-hydroxy-6-hydroxymethyldihydropteridine diphosphokinase
MQTAYLGLGSNVAPRDNIVSGIAALREAFGDIELSPVYQTPSFGFEGDDFINLAARIRTDLGPLQLKDFLHRLEDSHQRNRSAPKYSDRTLDIDILLYDDLYLVSPALSIPREEILTAPHVLKPLADLAPDLLHPVTRTTIAEIWAAFPRDAAKLTPIQL